MPQRSNSTVILLTILAVAGVGLFLFFTPRIPQWRSYHQFADGRSLWGISNFANVISNVLFIVVSLSGLNLLRKRHNANHLTQQESIVYFTLFIALFFVSLGSVYYHWSPDNESLVWDRIPMTIVFMALLSLTIMQRINHKVGFYLLFPLVIFGLFSVGYWYWTELSGQGDMRLYALVQFYSMILILLILFFFRKPYPPTKAYVWLASFYIMAKLTEYNDAVIYKYCGLVSGHTIKHVLAAFGAYGLIIMLKAKTHRLNSKDNTSDSY
jgi:Ceramidase